MARKPADQSVNRSEIIAAAADVLQRGGYEAATMKEIAAEVNMTAASLYHHFRNKDTLVLAVLEFGLEDAIKRLEVYACDQRLDPVSKLRGMIHAHIAAVTDITAVAAAMVFEIRALMSVKAPGKSANKEEYAAYAEFIARRDAFFKRRDYFENLFRKVIEMAVEQNSLRPLDAAMITKMLLGANNWVAVWYRPEGRLNGDEIAGLFTDAMLGGLLKSEHS